MPWIAGKPNCNVNLGFAFLHFLAWSVNESVIGETSVRDGGVSERRITYLSPTIQNDLTACCGQFSCEYILTEVWKVHGSSECTMATD
jgi:hypothetical protein